MRIRNFEKYQHYKDRNPPWIKMYAELWGDFRFFQLPDVSKAHLLGLFMLASKTDNKIPLDLTWIKHEIRATEQIDMQALLMSKFVETIGRSASKGLALRKQDAIPRALAERRDREETETETETEGKADLPKSKIQFGDNLNVWLTPTEYENLGAKYGPAIRQEFIQSLDTYPGTNPKKFAGYADHNLVLQRWIARAVKRGEIFIPATPKAHGPHVCRVCDPSHEWVCEEGQTCGISHYRACMESVKRLESARAQGATA